MWISAQCLMTCKHRSFRKLGQMKQHIKHLSMQACELSRLPPDVPPIPGDKSECMWMLSKHWEMSLIQASLSCAVGATRWIECLWPDFPSTKTLKSRLFAFTDSAVLKLLLCVEAEQSDSSSSLPASLGSSMSVASIRGIFPTSGSKCNRPAEVLRLNI